MRAPKLLRATAKELVATKNLVKTERVRALGSNYKKRQISCDSEEMKTPATFAGRIKLLAHQLGMSLTELSEEAGVSHSALSAGARAGGCRMKTLYKIRRRTGVHLDWLVCGDGEMGLVVLKKTNKNEAEDIAARTKSKRSTPSTIPPSLNTVGEGKLR